MEWLSSGLAAALSGGATSIFGLGIQYFVDYKKRQQAHAHELAMADKQSEQMDKEMELAKFKGKLDLETAIEEGHDSTLKAAIDAQSTAQSGSSQWVKDVCALTRPVLTGLLVIISACFIVFSTNEVMQAQFLYMATAATLYWFGDRARNKRTT
jgi:hypothetical protein